jgi:hypothetical protein
MDAGKGLDATEPTATADGGREDGSNTDAMGPVDETDEDGGTLTDSGPPPVEVCEKPAECDDGLYCNGVEACDPFSKDADGLGCLPGLPIVCDDAIACTVDACDEDEDRCVFGIDNGLCDDSKFCTGEETCNPTHGMADSDGCVDETRDLCDDGFQCTLDVCNEALGCVNTKKDFICSDGEFCTGPEKCDPEAAGADALGCIAGADPCDDVDPCTIDSCDEGLDTCDHDPDPGATPDDAGVCD